LGQTTEALSYLLKAHDLNPEDLDSVLSLGKAYEATGNHAQALAMYKQVELHNPDDDEIYYHLAMIYGKMKIVGESHYYFGVYFKKKERQQSALFHFREALKFFSKNQQKSQSIDNEIRELSKKKKK
jgi:tetratricopeptide (TPR) repeat protein